MEMTEHITSKLNGLLRGEITALETYRQALTKISDSEIRQELEKAEVSHFDRVLALSSKVRELGGEPVTDSGLWGIFAKAVEGSATVLGDKAAVSILEEGEDKGLQEYRTILENESGDELHALGKEFLLKQEATHELISALKRRLQ